MVTYQSETGEKNSLWVRWSLCTAWALLTSKLGGGIRLIVGFQPLMVISPTASWIQWRMQVYAW